MRYFKYLYHVSTQSPVDNSRTSQLADWTTRELADAGQKGKLSTQSRRWHPRVVQSATCPVRELSSLRVDQSARCPVRESSSPRVGNPRVGVSASCPVTVRCNAPFRNVPHCNTMQRAIPQHSARFWLLGLGRF